jgi:hypothetical protein
MNQRSRTLILGFTTAGLVLAVGVDLSLSRPPRPSAQRELHRQEMQVKRARRVTRRIVNDQRASEGIRQQARDLEQLLTERERTIASLEDLHRDFVARHRADIDELAALRQRAMEIDARLRTDRAQVLAAHETEVQSLASGAERADTLIDALTAAYSQDKRQRHRPRVPVAEP